MKIGLIMGSDSDFPIVEKAYNILKDFGVEVSVRVLSAHRTPFEALEFARSAADKGYELIIAAAGKAAHLPGVLAGCTNLPVIGIPIKSSELDGMDALFSIVQMPPGVPVATVGINAAENAALLAIQILSVKYDGLRDKFKDYKKQMAEKVFEKDKKLNERLK
ncbi:MAG: 5-(carboxyamino)imidazole ribonucleotide mutase [Bacillota bacterium]|jgi:5-(carboxyamino)imidazole ribonucleotide mutase|nr:5-(carboxyamino)imidazole ribonucleotide mutase [Bacillota bacterium]NLL59703.1 5-(carboxyamino)imidazole ribonucleotide mutase [Tissierellia bacterium]